MCLWHVVEGRDGMYAHMHEEHVNMRHDTPYLLWSIYIHTYITPTHLSWLANTVVCSIANRMEAIWTLYHKLSCLSTFNAEAIINTKKGVPMESQAWSKSSPSGEDIPEFLACLPSSASSVLEKLLVEEYYSLLRMNELTHTYWQRKKQLNNLFNIK